MGVAVSADRVLKYRAVTGEAGCRVDADRGRKRAGIIRERAKGYYVGCDWDWAGCRAADQEAERVEIARDEAALHVLGEAGTKPVTQRQAVLALIPLEGA